MLPALSLSFSADFSSLVVLELRCWFGLSGSIQPRIETATSKVPIAARVSVVCISKLFANARPPRVAPSRPPSDHIAWNAEKIGRLYAFSISTAWAFIATSVAPIPKPKTNSARPRVNVLVASPGSSIISPIRSAARKVAVLEPTRSMKCPTSWLAVRAPAPRTRSRAPIVECEISSLFSTYGMCTAQKVIADPAIVK